MSVAEAGSQGGVGTYRSALSHAPLRSLLLSHAASQVGQSLFTVAVTVVIWEQTRSVTWVAAAAACRLLPYVVFSSPAGVIADRYDRVAVLRLSHAVRAAVMVGLMMITLLTPQPWAVLFLALLATIAGTPCYPAVAALIPRTVATRDLAAANVLFTTLESTAFIVGPALGGVLLVVANPPAAFAVDAAVLVAAIVALPARRGPALTPPAEDQEPFLRQLVDGFRAVVESSAVAIPLLLMVVVNLVYGMSLVALLLVATQLMSTGAEGFGFLNAALGAGAFAVVVVSNQLAAHGKPLRVLAAAVIASGLPFAALAFVDWLPLAMVLLFVAGAGSVLTEVVAVTVLQRSLDDSVLARVFGILDATVIASVLAGSALVPPLVDSIGLRWTLVVGGGLVPLLAVVLAPRLRVMSRDARGRRRELGAGVRLLAGLPVLQGAPRPVLEGLAAAMPVETYDAGTTLITQGDTPDDFFAVITGRFAVYERDGDREVQVNALGPGDGFGEIGLLEHVPRTATVRALEPVTVYRVDGRQFVAAVSSAPAAAGSTPGGGLVGRMARTGATAPPTGRG